MLAATFYLLLTISISTKYAAGHVVDNSASVRNEAKSQTDDTQTAYFDSSTSRSNAADNIANHIRTSAINVTAIDNIVEMPKPNDADDYSISADDAVETGETFINFMESFISVFAFVCFLCVCVTFSV